MAGERRIGESAFARRALILAAMVLVLILLVLPLAVVLSQALAAGIAAYCAALTEPDTLSAIGLTLGVAGVAVPLNTVFGLCAAWCVTKFDFAGKRALLTLIGLPFSVSPVIAGLIFVLLFGRQGWLGPWLSQHEIKIIFAFPGLVLATVFVTLPMVARQLIPLMAQQGREDEEAATLLGAGGFRTFLAVTLPNIRWGLLYGVLLCNARAMGEFGAVSVVSGHIRGATVTLPLQIEISQSEFNGVAAFSAASLLAGLALATLVAKRLLEWRQGVAFASAERLARRRAASL
jgi:sulfate transport system permease protein